MISSLTNLLHRFTKPCLRIPQLTFFLVPTTVSRPKVKVVAGPAKSKAVKGLGVGNSRKSTSKIIQDPDNDSTELSDLVSGSEREGEGNGSVEDSDGMAQDSDDDFDGAKLTEKETEQVLHDEVKNSHLIILFYSFAIIATQRCFNSLRRRR